MTSNFWFPASMRAEGLVWASTDSQQLSDVSFLFENVFSKNSVMKTGFNQVPDTGRQGSGPLAPRYIFHTAFCCSTLLARALRFPGQTLDIKEPDILMQLANTERNQPGKAGEIVSTIERGLFLIPEKAIVKPTNAANRILPELMRHPNARAIIIHSDLDSFVMSIARKGEEGRSFARRLYNIFMMDDGFAQQLQPRDVFTLTDLQVAGFVWAIQCAQLQAALSTYPDKFRVVHCDDFLAAPLRTLSQANDFFKLGVENSIIETMSKSDLFAKNSKFPDQSFDSSTRIDLQKNASKAFAESLAFVRDWVAKLPHPKEISGPSLLA